ncbi:hypothetical protein EE612_009606, partial [Oryza sativa]
RRLARRSPGRAALAPSARHHRHRLLLLASTRRRSPSRAWGAPLAGRAPRDALSALDAALSTGYGYGYHDLLPLEERADALVARAEIELVRYLRCTLLNSGHRGQAIADLREAVRICPDNGRANALLLKYN